MEVNHIHPISLLEGVVKWSFNIPEDTFLSYLTSDVSDLRRYLPSTGGRGRTLHTLGILPFYAFLHVDRVFRCAGDITRTSHDHRLTWHPTTISILFDISLKPCTDTAELGQYRTSRCTLKAKHATLWASEASDTNNTNWNSKVKFL